MSGKAPYVMEAVLLFAYVIPKIWGFVEQKYYAKFTRPFFSRPNIKEKKRSGHARLVIT